MKGALALLILALLGGASGQSCSFSSVTTSGVTTGAPLVSSAATSVGLTFDIVNQNTKAVRLSSILIGLNASSGNVVVRARVRIQAIAHE